MEYLIAFFIGVVIFRFLKNSIGETVKSEPVINVDKKSISETGNKFKITIIEQNDYLVTSKIYFKVTK